MQRIVRFGWALTAPVILSLFLVGGAASASQGTTGNGAPSGPHFDLLIHGTNGPTDMSTGSNGHDIFVPLSTSGKDSSTSEDCDDIQLTQGPTFAVLNPDCWTGVANSPQFQLPPPCGSATTTPCSTTYTVWAKALTPKGNATMQTCYTDTTNTTYCATGAQIVSLTKRTGKGGFSDVSQQLLFYCSATTGTLEPIFSPANFNYFWDYDNNGLKLAQLRFYPNTSDPVTNSSCTNTTSI